MFIHEPSGRMSSNRISGSVVIPTGSDTRKLRVGLVSLERMMTGSPCVTRKGPRFIIRDRDDKYGAEFDRAARGVGTRVLRTPVRAPRANAFCERFLGSVRRECLDHVIALGERHLLEILVEYSRYFDQTRNHQGIGQLVPAGCSTAAAGGGAVIARPVLNGLHHDYRRAA